MWDLDWQISVKDDTIPQIPVEVVSETVIAIASPEIELCRIFLSQIQKKPHKAAIGNVAINCYGL